MTALTINSDSYNPKPDNDGEDEKVVFHVQPSVSAGFKILAIISLLIGALVLLFGVTVTPLVIVGVFSPLLWPFVSFASSSLIRKFFSAATHIWYYRQIKAAKAQVLEYLQQEREIKSWVNDLFRQAMRRQDNARRAEDLADDEPTDEELAAEEAEILEAEIEEQAFEDDGGPSIKLSREVDDGNGKAA